ncbi:hypothetical protein [Paraburkholderia sp. SIMBA_030]|uniref:hypothetical protein n=1 Tax=Paraburkholderia sp. SIMBA_030 TaxID=3085773 RepID=UPI00397B5092
MTEQWAIMGEPEYSETVKQLNKLSRTPEGDVQFQELATKALDLAHLGPINEPHDQVIDSAIFSPNAGEWRFGPIQARQKPH